MKNDKVICENAAILANCLEVATQAVINSADGIGGIKDIDSSLLTRTAIASMINESMKRKLKERGNA